MSKSIFAANDETAGATVERRKPILCGDEHEDTRAMIALWLDLCGYETTTAGRVAETLPLTEGGGFDLLLLNDWYADELGLDPCKPRRSFDA